MGVITFDGISSSSIGVTVEGYSSAPMAEKSVERVSVPGRNGNLIINNGSFLSYTQKYKMHWRRSNEARTSVVNWLYRDGYRKFVDSNDPNHFRMANFVGGTEIDNRMDVLDRAVFEFDFKPQRFLTSGDLNISRIVTEPNTEVALVNPTGFDAKPIIFVNRQSIAHTVTVHVNDQQFTILPGDYTSFYIDCDSHNVYYQNSNRNSKFIGDFPTLKSGNNTISFEGSSGNNAYISIRPRWWEL